MNGIPTYRFSQAAAAIGVTEAALRNWMTRNDLDLFGERPKGGWRSFNRKDVFVLALAAEMVRFGAPVKEAVDAARQGLGMTDLVSLEGMPRWLFCAPDGFGTGWGAWDDEGLAMELTGGPSLLKIAVPICLNNARKRLDAAA